MKFFVEPFAHQLQALEFAKRNKDLALFFDMGTGKTLSTINILRYHYTNARRLRRTLIFSPPATLYNWKNEFKKFSAIPEKDIIIPQGSGAARLNSLKGIIDDKGMAVNKIVLMNYEAVLNDSILELLAHWSPEILVCDESHYVKSPKAQRSKIIAKISSGVHAKGGNVFILTGTPILNTPMDIFQQYLVLDDGKTFGKNFFIFRNIYFKDKNAAWAGKAQHFADWIPREEMFTELNKKIYSKALRVKKEECLDLPPLIREVRHIELTPEQKKAYKEMERDFITFVQSKGEMNPVVAQLAITKALKLRQITSGFVKTEAGEEICFDKNSKLEVLKELLTELCPENKVIIFTAFVQNYRMLEKLCDKMGIEKVFITGEQSTIEKQKSVETFNSDPKVKVCIANLQSGSTGINLTASSYTIYYSLDFSLGNYLQSQARNHRSGSEIHEKITHINLTCMGTIDELTMESLDGKKQVSESIIDFCKNNLRRV